MRSFAVMRQRGIEEAFTFDRHFTAVGFAAVAAASALVGHIVHPQEVA